MITIIVIHVEQNILHSFVARKPCRRRGFICFISFNASSVLIQPLAGFRFGGASAHDGSSSLTFIIFGQHLSHNVKPCFIIPLTKPKFYCINWSFWGILLCAKGKNRHLREVKWIWPAGSLQFCQTSSSSYWHSEPHIGQWQSFELAGGRVSVQLIRSYHSSRFIAHRIKDLISASARNMNSSATMFQITPFLFELSPSIDKLVKSYSFW